MESFDFVVVGAGSAGCAVAARLSESGRHRVLLLEAGPSDRRPWILLPVGYGRTFNDPAVNWMYITDPVPGFGGRPVYQPRGKVLGGSSSINAMVYSRGQPGDFADWAAMGNPGWDWPDVLAAYRRMEDHYLGPSDLHGRGGPLHVTDIRKAAHPLTHLYMDAGREAGLAFNTDLNGEDIEGVGYYQINTRDGMRMSAARAYLWPAAGRGNLRVLTGAHVTRVLFEGRRAVGVAYERGGSEHLVRAGEVILSGGAINTPQLLQVSGVGPAEILRRNGVPVVLDSPAVGSNLQDHLCYDHVYRSRRPSLNDDFVPLAGKVRAALAYAFGRKGPLSLSVNQGGGFIRTRPDLPRPNVQLYFSPLTYERTVPGTRRITRPDPFSGFCTSVSPCRPSSRGHVAIRSADPRAAPTIVPDYLSTDHDIDEIVAGAVFLRRLAATPTLSALIEEELKPGPACDGAAAFEADVRARAYSVYHPCGTCRMGPDPATAVVDHRLAAHGLERLRIVDASVFPTITSGNINAPSIMVGERGAEFILEDAA